MCEALRAAFRATSPTDHLGRLRFARTLLALRQASREAYLEWRLISRSERTALRRGKEVVNLHCALDMCSGLEHLRASYTKMQDTLNAVRHIWQRNAKNYGAHGGHNTFPACVGEAVDCFRHENGLDDYYVASLGWMMTSIVHADELRMKRGHVGLPSHQVAPWKARYRAKADRFIAYANLVVEAWRSEHDRLVQTNALRRTTVAKEAAGQAFVEAFDAEHELPFLKDDAELAQLQRITDARRDAMTKAERALIMMKLRHELYYRHFQSLADGVEASRSLMQHIDADLKRVNAGDGPSE